jgi:hypothetical protein
MFTASSGEPDFDLPEHVKLTMARERVTNARQFRRSEPTVDRF